MVRRACRISFLHLKKTNGIKKENPVEQPFDIDAALKGIGNEPTTVIG
jgi:hypothetical protein